MRDSIGLLFLAIFVAVLLSAGGMFTTAPETVPVVNPPVPLDIPKSPTPKPKRRPNCPNCPQATVVAQADAHSPQLGGLVSPDGKTKALPLPTDWHPPHNIQSQGLGCCAYSAFSYAASWQHVAAFVGLPERMKDDGVPGGGWPEKLDNIARKYGQGAHWFNDTTHSTPLLSAIVASGRMACTDYCGLDPHYRATIAHCVNVIAFDVRNDWVAILDNNYPQMDQIVWMGIADFNRRWHGWVYGLLAATPGDCRDDGDDQHGWSYGLLAAASADCCDDGGSQKVEGCIDETNILTFGLLRPRRAGTDGASVDGQEVEASRLIDLIGPAMVPAQLPKVEIDHHVDLEGAAGRLAPFALLIMGAWALRELLKGQGKS